MFCKVCGEIMVYGPRGCACTRATMREYELREQQQNRVDLMAVFDRMQAEASTEFDAPLV